MSKPDHPLNRDYETLRAELEQSAAEIEAGLFVSLDEVLEGMEQRRKERLRKAESLVNPAE